MNKFQGFICVPSVFRPIYLLRFLEMRREDGTGDRDRETERET
jgi:hypothetical protein